MNRNGTFEILVLGLAVSLVLHGCANPAKKSIAPSSEPLSASAAQEIAIGEQIHAQILSSFYPYTDPEVVNYLNGIGQSLAAFAERKDISYRFTLLYNDKIYAASAPGGFVYLTTGFVYFLQNEAELAAVLAHEIARLQEKDPKLSRSRKVLDAVIRGGTMVGPAFGQIGALAALGLVVMQAVYEKNQPSAEDRLLEADRRALDYMVKAGYDPQGMIDLFYEFLNAEHEMAPYFYHYYQSRPVTMERFENLNKHFAALPLQEKTFSTYHERYQEIMRGVREIYNR